MSECLNVIQLYEASEYTNLLFLKRLLDLLQVGEQADVCTDLQRPKKSQTKRAGFSQHFSVNTTRCQHFSTCLRLLQLTL